MDFENLGLKIGDALLLEITSHPGSRYPVRLIGFCPKKGFITTPPLTQAGKLLFLKEGQAIVIRFAALNSVVAFNTHVLEDRTQPYPHIHIALPPKIESVEVRQALRLICEIPTTVINENTESSPVKMIITDLSPMGARLEGQVDIGQKGEIVSTTMQLSVSSYTYTVSVLGEIMVSGVSTKDGIEADKAEQPELYFGIKFQEIDAEDAAPLHAYVYQQMLKKHGLIS